MSVFSVALIFVIVWWIVFFMALPFGVKAPDNPEPGHTPSAPVKPRLWLKAGITTGIACVLTAIVVVIIQSDLIPVDVYPTP